MAHIHWDPGKSPARPGPWAVSPAPVGTRDSAPALPEHPSCPMTPQHPPASHPQLLHHPQAAAALTPGLQRGLKCHILALTPHESDTPVPVTPPLRPMGVWLHPLCPTQHPQSRTGDSKHPLWCPSQLTTQKSSRGFEISPPNGGVKKKKKTFQGSFPKESLELDQLQSVLPSSCRHF